MAAYHIAVKCGWPLGSMVVSVPGRMLTTQSMISASDMTICARRLVFIGPVCLATVSA